MTSCPACGHSPLDLFHTQTGVPTNSCLLLGSAAEAVAYPRGDLRLGFCDACGFIANTAFDPALAQYSSRYEETQGFSPRFVAFARDLAKRWVADYDLHGRSVCEIGCGKGEFLEMMVREGAGRGIGIDPGVHPERTDPELAGRIEWIADFYSPDYAELTADAIVCRHTLEHIGPVADFMRLIRRNLGERTGVPVLFELPDTLRVLRETAFWDVYYEHCSYFTVSSLAKLFTRTGFDVLEVDLDYDDQYIVLAARPSASETGRDLAGVGDDRPAVREAVGHFAATFAEQIGAWRERLAALRRDGGRAVLWGGGSKGVAFLAALGGDLVDVVVDINPHKQGMYMAGTGQRIVAPAALVAQQPDLVIAMNPVYLDEIQGDLDRLGVGARLVAV